MKIMLLAAHWGGNPGGIDRYLINVMNALNKFHHQCVFIYSVRNGTPIMQELPHFTEYQISGLEEFSSAHNQPVVSQIMSVAKKENPDIIFINHVNHSKLLQSLASAFPVVALFHDHRPFCLRETKRFYFRKKVCTKKLGVACLRYGHFIRKPAANRRWPQWVSLFKALALLRTLRTCDHLIVTSEYFKDQLMQHRFAAQKITVLPYLTPIPELQIEETYPRAKQILFAGRIADRYKGADFILDIFRRCKTDVRLVIVGGGAYLPTVKALCHRYGLDNRVVFAGIVPPNKMNDYFRQSLAFVMPSLWAEPFGMVGIEAMAVGTPVLAIDAGGVRQWLRHNITGYLVPWLDADQMAERIDHLATHPEIVKEMGMAARKTAIENYAEDRYVHSLLAIFAQAKHHFNERHD